VALAASIAAQITVDDFTADFESGNIDNVAACGVDSFTFEIRLDDNLNDLRGWFYFAITGNAGQTVTLFLTNRGDWQVASHVPVYSVDNDNWQRVNQTWQSDDWLVFHQTLDADTVWFAQCMPYTVSQFDGFLDSIGSTRYGHIDTLGASVHSRSIRLLTIADSSYGDRPRKRVWLLSRQHPMESPPTFLLEGLINAVADSTDFARAFRRGIDLHIVGIANQDGVAEGYSRHNVNGINLNRDWQWTIPDEQPEVQAIHTRIAQEVSAGRTPNFLMDLHAAPDHFDFGYRTAPGVCSEAFFANQGSFIHLLESHDPWQAADRWRDIDSSYAPGVSCVTLFNMYDIDCFSSENTWCRRIDSSFITEASLRAQGEPWARAIYDYVCPVSLVDTSERCGSRLSLQVIDFDQVYRDSLAVTLSCNATGDAETVWLPRVSDDGLFQLIEAIVASCGGGMVGDGIISASLGEPIMATYTDPDLPTRQFSAWTTLTGNVCGDINGNGGFDPDIADLIFLVTYMFQEGPTPPDMAACDMDGNGTPEPDIADLIYLVTFMFQNGPPLMCQ
jgi:hypothetical protein